MLFGPSGSGKSTVLRTIAGLVRPDEGVCALRAEDRVLLDTARRVFVPAHARPVRSGGAGGAAVSADDGAGEYRIRRGLAGAHAGDADEVMAEVMGLFRLLTLGGTLAGRSSGGERQRVSVARAVVSAVTFDGPGRALLLLDEPFSGLDAVMRDELAMAAAGVACAVEGAGAVGDARCGGGVSAGGGGDPDGGGEGGGAGASGGGAAGGAGEAAGGAAAVARSATAGGILVAGPELRSRDRAEIRDGV